MKAFLISFTLNNSERDYNAISEVIRSYAKWARISSQTWLIKTEDKITDVRTRLASSVNNEGHILVIAVTGASWATYAIGKDVTNWMRENL